MINVVHVVVVVVYRCFLCDYVIYAVVASAIIFLLSKVLSLVHTCWKNRGFSPSGVCE